MFKEQDKEKTRREKYRDILRDRSREANREQVTEEVMDVGEANSVTFSIFAWHCRPCQLLNASVSQTSIQLASTLPLHGCGGSDNIALITEHQNTYLAHMQPQIQTLSKVSQ